MEFLIGIILALVVALMASWSGLDRERGFYPTVLIVIASTYNLFAVMDGTAEIVIAELAPFALFVFAALLGFKKYAWLVVAGLAGHGIFDAYHSHLIANPGVPAWWPGFCFSYDVAAALYLAWRLAQQSGTHGSIRGVAR